MYSDKKTQLARARTWAYPITIRALLNSTARLIIQQVPSGGSRKRQCHGWHGLASNRLPMNNQLATKKNVWHTAKTLRCFIGFCPPSLSSSQSYKLFILFLSLLFAYRETISTYLNNKERERQSKEDARGDVELERNIQIKIIKSGHQPRINTKKQKKKKRK